MSPLTENKVVLVVRRTRLAELIVRFNTEDQARFYVEHLGADFSDYLREDRQYNEAVRQAEDVLSRLGRVQRLDRSFIPNFIFGPKDTVVALGQDGLVANVLKYLDGQPLVGVNPDRARWEGVLLPFAVGDLESLLPTVFRGERPIREVSMAKATLNTGETLYGVNDLFIGPRSHTSAHYVLEIGGQSERHSSSGIIVSTGLGSTGWLRSIVTGARGIAASLGEPGNEAEVGPAVQAKGGGQGNKKGGGKGKKGSQKPKGSGPREGAFAWNSDYLVFSVREPWPSTTSDASLVFGKVSARRPLVLHSQMPENGVIFSDGIEADFLRFNAGSQATITLAERKGRLVV